MKIWNFVTIAISGLILACNSPQTESSRASHEHTHAGTGVMSREITVWTSDYEFFLEIDSSAGESSTGFLLHVTLLDDFTPLQSESVSIVIGNHSEPEIIAMHQERPGIFNARYEHPLASDTPLEVRIMNQKYELFHGHDHDHAHSESGAASHDHNPDSEESGHLHKEHIHESPDHHGTGDDHAHEHIESEHSPRETGGAGHDHESMLGTEFTITKEQQWLLDMQVAVVDSHVISQTVQAIAQVLPSQERFAKIVSPVDGFLNLDHNHTRVAPGQRVTKGETLVTICPPVGTSNTLAERVLSFRQARNNYERAQALMKREAISEREFDEIEQDYLIARSSYETLLQAYGVDDLENGQSCMHLALKAPLSGIVQELHFVAGQSVSSGQELLSVVDPSRVWLEVQVFEDDFYKLDRISQVSLRLPGQPEPMVMDGSRFTLLNKGQTMQAESRTIPLLIELANTGQRLKIGQVVSAQLSGSQENKQLVLPRTALVDEDTNFFVFVQHGGEVFEKRPVRIGIKQQDRISIVDGLLTGERVVTKGAFRVNLATSQTNIGHGHIH